MASHTDSLDMTTVKMETVIVSIKHSKDYLCKKALIRDVKKDIDLLSYTSANPQKCIINQFTEQF